MTNFRVGIVAPAMEYAHWPVFADAALALSDGKGFHAIEGDASGWTGRWLVLGANLLPFQWKKPIRIPKDSILLNLEQVPGPWINGPYLNVLRQFEVWDYSQQGIDGLRDLGIEAKLCRIGYHPCLTRIEPGDETIDVLFYGSTTERRLKIIRALCDEGINVQTLLGCYGAPRDEWVGKAKLILNLHSWERPTPLEIVRLQLLFANRKCVVTETCAPDDLEWESYRGCMVEIDADRPKEAAFTIKMLLADQETRFRVGKLGFDVFSRNLQASYLPDFNTVHPQHQLATDNVLLGPGSG